MDRIYVPREAFVRAAKAGHAPADALLRKQAVGEVKQLEAQGLSRSRQFVVSTNAVDRDNDTVNQDGWLLDNFKKNPVVLFAHDYSSLPIGRCTEIGVQNGALVATAEFASHPMAEQVLQLIDGGFLRATSVGFRPTKYAFNEDRGGWSAMDFEEQELLEFSVVPVPANPEALMVARAGGADLDEMRGWAEKVLEAWHEDKGVWVPKGVADRVLRGVDKGVSPKDVSLEKAPDDAAWSAPSLGDLSGGKDWADMSASEKRAVAGHFAWAAEMPPSTFGDCKLPHHQKDGKVVWRGVAAAAARMNQASIPSGDDGLVKAHLGRHYKAFGKTPPWEANADGWAAYEAKSRGRKDEDLPLLLMAHSFQAEALALVPPAPEAKRGRTLSAANEDRIKKAKAHLDEVLSTLPAADDDPPPANNSDGKDVGDTTCCMRGCDKAGVTVCGVQACGHVSCSEHLTTGGQCGHHASDGKSARKDDDPTCCLKDCGATPKAGCKADGCNHMSCGEHLAKGLCTHCAAKAAAALAAKQPSESGGNQGDPGDATCCGPSCAASGISLMACAGQGCTHFACALHRVNGKCVHCQPKAAASTFEFDLEDDGVGFTADDIRAALRDTMRAVVGEVVLRETQATVNRLTGRVD